MKLHIYAKNIKLKIKKMDKLLRNRKESKRHRKVKNNSKSSSSYNNEVSTEQSLNSEKTKSKNKNIFGIFKPGKKKHKRN